uniref:GWxTD domain-containing protein n=1 Tax=candidate division WOR-3 bacterium TaxID=2052148 RepID=A0A7V0Z606_UNCW3
MEVVIQRRLKTILKKLGRKEILYCICFFIFGCATNIITARYYRLLEKERPIFLGLRGIDSVTADKYLNLPSATERKYFYDQYWQGRNEERQEFERRAEYAFKEFGKYAPLSDERIPIYVKYGKPTRRYVITPEKKAGIVTREYVNPAEVWTYKNEGIEFDFIRLARAYKIIARSRFGDSVIIPYLKEEESNALSLDTIINDRLNFNIAYGRFRQRRDLVRLEIYARLMIDDTTGCRIARRLRVYDQNDSLITDKINLLIPVGGDRDYFYDEINAWLSPQKYRILVEYSNLKSKVSGRKEFFVDLLDYKNDAKKISDLVFANLIDESLSDEKFFKPVGRVIPMVHSALPIATPFYIYHEVYNLKIQDGQHLLRIDYEIYNKEKMRKEIVDIMSQTESSEGDVGYIAAKYHPMDLPHGNYIIVAKITDMLSGEQFTAVGEFTLEKVDK